MAAGRKKIVAVLLLSLWSIVLTGLTAVFGAAPLRALRLALGGWGYWTLTLTLSGGLLGLGWGPLGFCFLAISFVVGLFAEFEERGHGLISSAVGSLLVTSMFVAGGFAFWVAHQPASWLSGLTTFVEAQMNLIPHWQEVVKIEAKDLVLQLPSGFVVLMVMALYLSLVFQKRMQVVLGIRRAPHYKLAKFHVPESFIWILVLAVAGTFMKWTPFWVSPIGANLLNVALVVFFLQGLAVVVSYLEAMKLSPFWQLIILVSMVVQLFLVVALIGVADYWMDFRSRLNKRAQPVNREI